MQQAIKRKVNTLIENKNQKQILNLHFYEYTKGDWGESGTAYFLKYEERRDGMTAELLEYYPEFERTQFNLQICDEKELDYLGILTYYKNRKRVKTDTIVNFCTN